MDDLDAVKNAYLASLPPGTVQRLDLTPLDRTAVPTISYTWHGINGHSVATGFGETPLQAEVGALGEMAEGLFPEARAKTEPLERGTLAVMQKKHGAAHVIDPLRLGLPVGSSYRSSDELLWLQMRHVRSGEAAYVPAEFVISDPETLDGVLPTETRLVTPITNGLGAGLSAERALSHAILEILQRDGDNLKFRALDQGRVLDVTALGSPEVASLISSLQAVGVNPLVKLAGNDFVPVVYCVGETDSGSESEPVAISGIGEAAHPDLTTAVTKAILEMAASRSRRIFAFGRTANLRRFYPEYVDSLRTRNYVSEPRALAAMVDWCRMSELQLRHVLQPIFRRTSIEAPRHTEVAPVGSDEPEFLRRLLALLSDFDVLAYESVDGDVHTAKVLIPGLEVETLSYGRMGIRALRELQASHPSVVRSSREATSDDLEVRLPISDCPSGPTFIAAGALEGLMGSLYPLYREPVRHHAPILASL